MVQIMRCVTPRHAQSGGQHQGLSRPHDTLKTTILVPKQLKQQLAGNALAECQEARRKARADEETASSASCLEGHDWRV